MSDSLKGLLEAESEAELLVSKGEKEREKIIQKALDDTRNLEVQFNDRVPEMHQTFIDKAHERAVRTIAEMKLRYDEHNKELRSLAGKNEKEALRQAVSFILDDSNQ